MPTLFLGGHREESTTHAHCLVEIVFEILFREWKVEQKSNGSTTWSNFGLSKLLSLLFLTYLKQWPKQVQIKFWYRF